LPEPGHGQLASVAVERVAAVVSWLDRRDWVLVVVDGYTAVAVASWLGSWVAVVVLVDPDDQVDLDHSSEVAWARA